MPIDVHQVVSHRVVYISWLVASRRLRLRRNPVEVGIAAVLLCGVAEDAEAGADEDREVEGLLGLAAEGFPGRAVEGILEAGLVLAVTDGGTEINISRPPIPL